MFTNYSIDIIDAQGNVLAQRGVDIPFAERSTSTTDFSLSVRPKHVGELTTGVNTGLGPFTLNILNESFTPHYGVLNGSWGRLYGTGGSWDPTGTKLIASFRGDLLEDGSSTHGVVWNAATGYVEPINFVSVEDSPLWTRVASWSPTGEHIAFIASGFAQSSEYAYTLAVIESYCWQANSCVAVPVLTDPYQTVYDISWFPNGEHLAYTTRNALVARSAAELVYELNVVSIATGTVQPMLTADAVEQALDAAPRPTAADAVLPAQPAFFRDVAVSPDGQHVAFLFFSYTSTAPVATEVRLMFLDMADGTLTPTEYVVPNAGALTPVGLAWGPPLPEGVLPTPTTPTPTD